jgi:hypothetical protein
MTAVGRLALNGGCAATVGVISAAFSVRVRSPHPQHEVELKWAHVRMVRIAKSLSHGGIGHHSASLILVCLAQFRAL